MKSILFQVAGVVALTLAISAPVQASTVTWQDSGSPFDGNGHASVKIKGPGLDWTNVSAGGFDLNSGDLGDFVAWCLDLKHTIKNNWSYTETDSPFDYAGMTPGQIGAVQALFNTAYDFVLANITNNIVSAGFQLALWEARYETGAYGFGSGTFQAKYNADAINAANGFLSGIGGPQTSNYDLIFLQSDTVTDRWGNKKASQNLVTGSVSQVPLPAAGLLLLGALGGLGALRRRKKTA